MVALDQQVLMLPRPHTMSTWENQWLWTIWNVRGKYPPNEVRDALIELLRREWFLRVWVLQEAALAKSATITCGRNEVNSRAFVVLPSLLSVNCTEVQQSRLDILPGLLRVKSWWGGSSSKSLITLIQKFGKSEASDPRDVIYALLGLSGDTHSSDFLRPDYQISLEEAIQRSVAYFMIQANDLPRHSPVQTLPKWNIDTFLASLGDLSFSIFRWATVNAQDLLLYDLLISQKDKQDVELIKRYMSCSGDHGPPITIAMKKENMPLTELLMKFPDAEVEKGDKDGNSPLSIATGQGNTVVMDWISARRQLDVHRRDDHDKMPLWIAANQHFPSVQRFFNRVEFDTPLLTAVKQKDPAVEQLILEHGEESTNLVDSNGDGLLNIAVRMEDAKIVEYLLKKTKSDDLSRFRGSNGLTPFESALVAGSPAIINTFLAYQGQRVIHSAVKANQFGFLHKILDVQSLPAESRDWGLCAALGFAAWEGYTKIVSLFLDNGADINNLSDYAGRIATPLWIAVARGNLEMVRLLVERGADIEVTAEEFPFTALSNLEMWPYPKSAELSQVAIGLTMSKPIWVAASLGYVDVVRFLIQHGADIDSRDSFDGLSPFWRAAQQNQPEVMRALIEAGADVRPNRLVGWGDWHEVSHRPHHELMSLEDQMVPKNDI